MADPVATPKQSRDRSGRPQPPDPWPEPVDGEALLDDLVAELRRYLVLPLAAAYDAIALWILHAWTHDSFQISPLLLASSPTKRCGKSTLADLLASLTPHSLYTSNVTAPALFRRIDAGPVTLIIDEADTFLRRDAALIGLLNSGHKRRGGIALRVGRSAELSTWSPKAVIGIGAKAFRDTLVDRSIVIELQRKTKREIVEHLRLDLIDAECEPFVRRAMRWANDHAEALRHPDPDVPSELHDRARDNWRTLLAISEAAGPRWKVRGAAAARATSGGTELADDSEEIVLLVALAKYFDVHGPGPANTEDIINWLCTLEDQPWVQHKGGKRITPHAAGRLLSKFGIKSRVFRKGDATRRGYEAAQFRDAFERYLPDQSETNVTAKLDNELRDTESET